MSADLLTGADVARMLRRSPRWFYARRRALVASGFPGPCPEFAPRTVWRRGAVEAWVRGDLDRPIAAAGRDAEAELAAELGARGELAAAGVEDTLP